VKPVAINARRWFDGQNTYHSVRVIFNDGTERVAPFAYGYGEQFLHTAGELCGMADPYDCTTRWCREAKVTIDVVDVTRRDDERPCLDGREGQRVSPYTASLCCAHPQSARRAPRGTRSRGYAVRASCGPRLQRRNAELLPLVAGRPSVTEKEQASEFERRRNLPGVRVERLCAARMFDVIVTLNGRTIAHRTESLKRGKIVSTTYFLPEDV
jgi:hypothetical protein